VSPAGCAGRSAGRTRSETQLRDAATGVVPPAIAESFERADRDCTPHSAVFVVHSCYFVP